MVNIKKSMAVLFQDLNQNNAAELDLPEGLLSVSLLRHQVSYAFDYKVFLFFFIGCVFIQGSMLFGFVSENCVGMDG